MFMLSHVNKSSYQINERNLNFLYVDLFFLGHQDAPVGSLPFPCLLGSPICHGDVTQNAIRLDISAIRLLVRALFIQKYSN